MSRQLNRFRGPGSLAGVVFTLASLIGVAAAAVYHGAVSRDHPIAPYQGSSFNEVLEILNEKDLRARTAEQQELISKYSGDSLPQYEVSLKTLFDHAVNNLRAASRRTIDDRADYYLDGFTKFVHPNGICMAGDWEITEASEYTGYFAKGKRGKVISRASVALGDVKIGKNRSFAMALKLFPTEVEDQVVETLNMFAMDSLLGSSNTHYLQSAITNHPTVTPQDPNDEHKIPSLGLAATVTRVFKATDTSQRYRPIEQIGRSGTEEGSARAPIYMRVRPISGTRLNDQKDFRREIIRGFAENGQKLVFTIEVSDQPRTGWRALGKVTYNRLMTSYSCDRRLHFAHPRDDHRSGLRPLSGVLQRNFATTLASIQDTSWSGTFKGSNFRALRPISCSAKIDVYFFPATVEPFSNGRETVSYRHHGAVPDDASAFCKALARLSPVDTEGGCTQFPTKYSVPEGREVPFRTVIPSADGKSAIVSSPSCKKVHSKPEVVRSELQLVRLVLSPDGNRLDVEMHLNAKVGNQVIPVALTYDLVKRTSK